MKRKTLIRAAALALTAALLFTGCTARTPEENPESSGGSQNSMAEPEKAESSGTKAAAVAVPLENAPSIIPMPEERPYLYEENGSYGIRAADGSVLVPAEYAFGYDFDDNGLGQLRKDVGEEITWYKVGLDGTLLGDVNDTVVQTGAGPVVVVEKWNDDSSEGVFQLMNLNLEPLLPEWAEYLYHTNYYAGQKNRFFLRMPGGKLAEFLPEEMALLEFEPYDESRAELYQASWDLAEEEVVVVNGQALFGADAHSWETEDLPLPALEQVDWTIRTEDGLRQTRLSMGQNPDYDIVSFYAEGQGEPTDQIHGEDWIAVPGTVTDWPENEPAADPAALLELTGDYCADRGIDPDCMEVTEAVQGEFGVVLALNGGYKRTQEEAGEDSWAHAAVLWYPDKEDSSRYMVLDQFESAGFRSFMSGGYGIVGVFPGKGETLRVMTRAWGYEGPAQYQWFPLTEA